MSVQIAIITTLILLTTYKVTAITYGVYNPYPESPGAARFEREVGIDYTLNQLSAATDFIYHTFHQTENLYERKPGITRVTVHIVPWKGEVRLRGTQIYISSIYIRNYNGDIKREITRIIYREMTHVLQWTGNGQAPSSLIEGIADYVKIKAGYPDDPPTRKKPGDGQRWDQGYEITAYFLFYCETLRPGFVAELNERLKEGFDLGFFERTLGKPVERVWDDYKEKYGRNK